MNKTIREAKHSLVARLMGLFGPLGLRRADVFENPTEEIIGNELEGRRTKLYGMAGQRMTRGNNGNPFAGQAPVDGRIEEMYLWSTRRWPNNTANDVIGAGALTAGDFDYFGQGIGDLANTMGYANLGNLTPRQTNMDKGGKIPKGIAFRMFELGVSFNESARAQDIAALCDASTIRFEKQAGSLVIQVGPPSFWPGGTGISGFSTNVTSEAASNGMPNINAVRKFRFPRELNANDSFKYVWTTSVNKPATNAAVALSNFVEATIFLYGYQFAAIAG